MSLCHCSGSYLLIHESLCDLQLIINPFSANDELLKKDSTSYYSYSVLSLKQVFTSDGT